jgi:hypothetical protein
MKPLYKEGDAVVLVDDHALDGCVYVVGDVLYAATESMHYILYMLTSIYQDEIYVRERDIEGIVKDNETQDPA